MMARAQSIKGLIKKLAAYGEREDVYNPWKSYNPELDFAKRAYKFRQEQLSAYLEDRMFNAKIIVVAEAIGYQGGRFTGIAMTCERMIMGHHPQVGEEHIFSEPSSVMYTRTSSPLSHLLNDVQREKGFNEPTDTVVWGSILESNINPFDVILWNIFPFHPHHKGNPLSNRTPTAKELQEGWGFLEDILCMNPYAQVLAVGKKAGLTLEEHGMKVPILRHPANGGAKLFKEQFKEEAERIFAE